MQQRLVDTTVFSSVSPVTSKIQYRAAVIARSLLMPAFKCQIAIAEQSIVI
jgi:hypothetical protein